MSTALEYTFVGASYSNIYTGAYQGGAANTLLDTTTTAPIIKYPPNPFIWNTYSIHPGTLTDTFAGWSLKLGTNHATSYWASFARIDPINAAFAICSLHTDNSSIYSYLRYPTVATLTKASASFNVRWRWKRTAGGSAMNSVGWFRTTTTNFSTSFFVGIDSANTPYFYVHSGYTECTTYAWAANTWYYAELKVDTNTPSAGTSRFTFNCWDTNWDVGTLRSTGTVDSSVSFSFDVFGFPGYHGIAGFNLFDQITTTTCNFLQYRTAAVANNILVSLSPGPGVLDPSTAEMPVFSNGVSGSTDWSVRYMLTGGAWSSTMTLAQWKAQAPITISTAISLQFFPLNPDNLTHVWLMPGSLGTWTSTASYASTSDVRLGINRGDGAQGVCRVPASYWVLKPYNYDANDGVQGSQESTDPGIANVIKPIDYKINSQGYQGIFDEAARNTDPGIDLVIKDTNYKIQNVGYQGTFNEAARNVDPTEALVKNLTAYKILDVDKVGSYTAGSPPSTPTITFVDTGDGTGGVITVAGSDVGTTNQLYYFDGATFQTGNSRTSDGTINFDMTTIGDYYVYVRSSDVSSSSVTLLLLASVTDTTGTSTGLPAQNLILKFGSTYNIQKKVSDTWTTQSSVYAWIQSASSRNRIMHERRDIHVTHRMYSNDDNVNDIKEGWRIEKSSRYWLVVGCRNTLEQSNLYCIDLQEMR